MQNDLPYKVMIWKGGDKSSFHYPTLHAAASFFIEVAKRDQCFPEDFPGSPEGEIWYSWMCNQETGQEIILAWEYDVATLDPNPKVPSNPPYQFRFQREGDQHNLLVMFPTFRFTIWDKLPGDNVARRKIVKIVESLFDDIKEDSYSDDEVFWFASEAVKKLKRVIDAIPGYESALKKFD